MAPSRASRTYRVRQLPSYLKHARQVADLLAGIAEDLGGPDNIQVFSLATNLNPLEIPPSKVATLMFKQTPPPFDNDLNQWLISGKSIGFARDIIVDVHFLDFTPLNDVPPDDHRMDCIAISGLASHPFGSWKQRGSRTTFMWLRDRLPRDIPNTRSIIYGYDTQLIGSESVKGIEDIAIGFIWKMKSIGRSSPSSKPFMLLGHSLGGIVLKQAVALMAGTKDWDPMIEPLLGAIFFGVPNKGMKTSHLLPMVDGQPNEKLVHVLSPASEFLPSLDEQFSGIATHRRIKIMSIYETKRSPTTKMSVAGVWERTGPPDLLVDSKSAIQQNSHRTMPVDEDHSNLVKFGDDDPDCRVIIDYIHEIASDTQRIKASLENAASLEPERHLSKKTGDEPKIDDMLQSLNIVETGYRLDEIQERCESTFEWLYDNEDLGFVSWLREEPTGLYWINGKPGSGKSTLMKFARRDARTYDFHDEDNVIKTEDWPDRTHIIIDFFFHDRGTSMQKSLEGLLHRLLYQLIDANNKLGQLVLPSYSRRRKEQQLAWTIEDLKQALQLILDQKEIPVYVLFFLDAMDEFDGDAETVAEFVKYLVKPRIEDHGVLSTNIKVCCSSRPWNIFNDSFQDIPGFKIHEHTQDDIHKYVTTRLTSNIQMRLLNEQRHVRGEGVLDILTVQICERAEGVFVWVRIVLDELLKACTDGASPTELISVLSSFPDDLDASYQRLIDRIEPAYLFESYVMIEILLRSKDALGLRDFGLTVLCALSSTPSMAAERLPADPYSEEFLNSTRRRIQSRCGGLLEVLPDTTVQFMHQTAKSFFSRPGASEAILGHDPKLLKENGFSFLAKFWITLAIASSQVTNWWAYILTMFRDDRGYNLRSMYFGSGAYVLEPHHLATEAPTFEFSSRALVTKSPLECLYWAGFNYRMSQGRLIEYIYLAETSTGRSQKIFLDEIPERELSYFYEDFGLVKEPPHITSRLSFAVAANLRLYLRETLEKTTNGELNHRRPLLHCLADHMHRFPYKDASQMAQLLLDFGASKSKLHSGIIAKTPLTPFQIIFWHVFKAEGLPQRLIELAQTFLDNGQDVDGDVFCHELRDIHKANAFNPLPPPSRCKLLHVANLDLMKVLLKYHPSINVLDNLGQTPLDINLLLFQSLEMECEKPLTKLFDTKYHDVMIVYQKEVLERIILLLDNGACLKFCGDSEVMCLRMSELVQEDPDLVKRFKRIPRLQRRRREPPTRYGYREREPSVSGSEDDDARSW